MSINQSDRNRFIISAAPVVFTLLWSTGFVGAKLSAEHADPITFLALRMLLSGILVMLIGRRLKVPLLPDIQKTVHAALAGIMLNAVYLGGVFYVTAGGFPIALTALIVGLQPIVTSIGAVFVLKERLRLIQVIALILGFIGVWLVLKANLPNTSTAAVTPGFTLSHFILACTSMLSITVGTLYQKKFCSDIPLLTGVGVHYMASAAVLAAAAFFLEEMRIEWTAETVFAMAWLVLVLSVSAMLILVYLIRQNSAAKVTSLFYLVPVLVAVEGFVLFERELSIGTLIGGAVSLCGVALAVKK